MLNNVKTHVCFIMFSAVKIRLSNWMLAACNWLLANGDRPFIKRKSS
jgi:hypothetical protein